MINNIKICKARELFINKGILNRKILSDKIIYSWVRSKLHNISFEILDNEHITQSVDLLSINKKTYKVVSYLRKVNLKNTNVFVMNEFGSVVYKTNNNFVDLPLISNFCEESIGTTAAGITITTGVHSRVVGCEHYNRTLTSYVTEAFMIKGPKTEDNLYICLLSKFNNIEEHTLLFEEISSEFLKKEVIVENRSDENKEVIQEKNNSKAVKSDDIPEKDLVKYKVENEELSSNAKVCKVFTLSIIEKNTIREALEYYSWNMKRSAEALGIGRSTLYRKIKEYSIKQ